MSSFLHSFSRFDRIAEEIERADAARRAVEEMNAQNRQIAAILHCPALVMDERGRLSWEGLQPGETVSYWSNGKLHRTRGPHRPRCMEATPAELAAALDL
jgi:hypothetical protein